MDVTYEIPRGETLCEAATQVGVEVDTVYCFDRSWYIRLSSPEGLRISVYCFTLPTGWGKCVGDEFVHVTACQCV